MKGKREMNQHERIYHYLKDFGSITPFQAFADLGITKLSTRIGEMKRKGIKIRSEMVSAKNRYGDKTEFMKYWLGEEK